MSESDYFKAMFSNHWLETNYNCLELKETVIKPFINVLKIVYGFDFNNEDLEVLEIPELIESLIIAIKYQFTRVEKILSQKIISKFPSILDMNNESFQQI
jgi:hypothetical protein